MIVKQEDSLLGDKLLVRLLKEFEVLEGILDLRGRNLLLLEMPLAKAKFESSMDLLDVIHVARPGGDFLGVNTGVRGPELLLLEERFVGSLRSLETKLKIN